LRKHVVVGLYWGGVVWWAFIGKTWCGGVVFGRVVVGLCLGRRAVVRMVVRCERVALGVYIGVALREMGQHRIIKHDDV
jgi:hypothetical protein